MPCGYTKRPAPKFLITLPSASNSQIGLSWESAHAPAPAMQRSATQMWPLGAAAIALIPPSVLPAGNCGQLASLYGLGWEFGSSTSPSTYFTLSMVRNWLALGSPPLPPLPGAAPPGPPLPAPPLPAPGAPCAGAGVGV